MSGNKSTWRLSHRLKNRFDAWARDRRGATAVEFALVATPFFFLLFGLFEVAIIFIMTTTLEHGINESSRAIRTGAFQSAQLNQAAFRNAVCSELFDLLDCDTNLHIDVRTFGNFGGAMNNSPVDPGTQTVNPGQFQFNPGGPNDIVVARVFYEWTLLSPVISKPLANLSGNKRLLQASVAFRNEPFGGAGAPGTP